MTPYRGRFAPSPTGPLHAGSLAAALASWLDARAMGGVWLIRIEDLDPPRVVPGAASHIIETLGRCGLVSDEPIVYQSDRGAAYQAAFDRLFDGGLIYGCACSRKDVDLAIEATAGGAGSVYPGICANGAAPGKSIRSYRVRVPEVELSFDDRFYGHYSQQLKRDVGDFVVKRADGLWAYQLAVIVDDAAQGITHVVRGADLLDNTPRQLFLHQALGLSAPLYLHVPLVLNQAGEKLSKQSGATAVDASRALDELNRAAAHLGLPHLAAPTANKFLELATDAWRQRKLDSAHRQSAGRSS